MNYYIQGDAAKAEQIKAAFESKGYDVTGFDMCNYNILFFTYELEGGGKVISTTNANLYTANIIKTHPDYKELELQIAPKFKVGDWIINRFRDICLITDIDLENGYYICETNRFDNTDGDIDLTDKAFHLWTIQDAKDGDVLVLNGFSKEYKWIGIFKALTSDTSFSSHCHYNCGMCEFITDIARCTKHGIKYNDIRPATNEERDILFAKIREAGHEWDADKKELRKIKLHYDISNFHAGMPVLVRETSLNAWQYVLFSHCYIGGDGLTRFNAGLVGFTQCIPFNDDTKHLLGTTDMCDERFINW